MCEFRNVLLHFMAVILSKVAWTEQWTESAIKSSAHEFRKRRKKFAIDVLNPLSHSLYQRITTAKTNKISHEHEDQEQFGKEK